MTKKELEEKRKVLFYEVLEKQKQADELNKQIEAIEYEEREKLHAKLLPHIEAFYLAVEHNPPCAIDITRRDPERCAAGRPSDRAADDLHAGRQRANGGGDGHRASGVIPCPRRRGDRMRAASG